ncbi:hypothetical protein [Fimbriiglobus ruber]|uniref:Uncharacterized protein n=1 Tax=Fimbriiglobus ruber TaxID=1908690 RepID=A0A225DLF3_9BACT|nr:hypothetical protein [Fimbriiglobus ruber]OWK42212.1 hypothetical protein FRUB_04290 [Fimbriiglobus ruber]
MADPELKREAGNAVLKRLILWVEKEAHLAGADIEPEITSIMAKLQSGTKK